MRSVLSGRKVRNLQEFLRKKRDIAFIFRLITDFGMSFAFHLANAVAKYGLTVITDHNTDSAHRNPQATRRRR
ncbi:hypothetical protein [Pacificoceanicola onchidii]|uniref:hypothetical protein n=1 Tax=Pacificoceanicola onchidii TaxID=2562685 RepID=UPI0010A34888|nr:hypothetical protein [Pacificoceanicola onchidii]